MVGGTGLYIQAFCEGFDLIPEIGKEVRRKIKEEFGTGGLAWLSDMLHTNDPVYLQKDKERNPHRMMRALEVKLGTGTSILEFQAGKRKNRNFEIIKIGLELPRDLLNRQIDDRVDKMMKLGLLKEAERLYPFKNLNALRTVGYRELFDHIDGLLSLDEAVAKIKINTHRYAKRQMTWFKRDAAIRWQHPEQVMKIR